MRIKSIIILSTAILLASCSKEIVPDGGGLQMRVVPSLASEGVKASITTADLTEFWLRVDCPSNALYSYFCKVSKNSTGWSPDKQLLWKDETTAVSYSAAYFNGHDFTKAEFTDGVDLSVPADQSTQAVLNAADLLTLSGASKKYTDDPAGELPVALAHGLTKVNIVLSLGRNFYNNRYGRTANPVTALTVTGANLGFNFKPATGAVTVTADTKANITPFALSYTPGTATAKTSVATYEAILVPQTFTAGTLSVSFKVGDKDYIWTNAEAITLTAGQTVNLPVSVTAAPPASPFINGHEYMDMGEVEINGVKKHLLWATCNIGAENPWDYGDYFDWGGITPYYQAGHSQDNPCSDWIDGKDGYNWENYSFMQTDQSDWNYITKYTVADGQTDGIWYDGGGNFIGDGKTSLADYNYADDAASKLWGGDWRIPMDEEWQALLGADYTWVWTTDYLGSGKNGMLVTRNDDGSGTDPCAGNSIFFPAAGCRGSSILTLVGSCGYYWSSSLYTVDSSLAWVVGFYSGGVIRSYDRRYYGNSIRPVTE
jgi:hypothetical protein